VSWRLRQAFALTRTELGTLAPAARWLCLAGVLGLAWLRFVVRFDAPIGSDEQEGLLTLVGVLAAAVLLALPFDGASRGPLARVLRPMPVRAHQATLAKLSAGACALAVVVAMFVTADLGLALVAPEGRSTPASSMIGSREFRAVLLVVAGLGLATTVVAAALFQHTLGAVILGGLVLGALVTEGYRSDVVRFAVTSSAGTIVAVATTLCLLASPLRGRRGPILVRRAAGTAVLGLGLGSIGIVNMMLMPALTLEDEHAWGRCSVSPDGRKILVCLAHERRWPSVGHWLVDVETLAIEPVDPPGPMTTGLFGVVELYRWSDDSSRIEGRIFDTRRESSRTYADRTMDGEWITGPLDSSYRPTWQRRGWSREAIDPRSGTRTWHFGSDRTYELPKDARLAVARDEHSTAIAWGPDGLVIRIDSDSEDPRQIADLGKGSHLWAMSPDGSMGIVSTRYERRLLDLRTGEIVTDSARSFTGRGTVVIDRTPSEVRGRRDGGPRSWFERDADLERPLPFPDAIDVAHLRDDLWLVRSEARVEIRSTQGDVLLEISPNEHISIVGLGAW